MSYSQHLSLTIDYKPGINILTSLDKWLTNRGCRALSRTVSQPTCEHCKYSTTRQTGSKQIRESIRRSQECDMSDVCVVQCEHIDTRLLSYDTDESPTLIHITTDLFGESDKFSISTLAIYYISTE